MLSFLRTLAFPTACAFTGAATALLVTAIAEPAPPPPPACPEAPAIHIRHEMTPLAPPAPPAPPSFVIHSPKSLTPAELAIPEGAVRCAEVGRCVVDRGFYMLLRDNPSLLQRQAYILPSVRDGQVRGLKFYAIRRGSLPNKLGLKNGDLLTAVNGVPVTQDDGVPSAEALMQFLSDRERPVFSLAIERKGEPVNVTIDVAWQQEQARAR